MKKLIFILLIAFIFAKKIIFYDDEGNFCSALEKREIKDLCFKLKKNNKYKLIKQQLQKQGGVESKALGYDYVDEDQRHNCDDLVENLDYFLKEKKNRNKIKLAKN